MMRENLKDGKKDGLCEYYNMFGQLGFKENYKEGKPDGLWGWYDKNGKLIK